MEGEVWTQKYKMPSLVHLSPMPNSCLPPGKKWSGEQNQISWASTHFCNSVTYQSSKHFVETHSKKY